MADKRDSHGFGVCRGVPEVKADFTHVSMDLMDEAKVKEGLQKHGFKDVSHMVRLHLHCIFSFSWHKDKADFCLLKRSSLWHTAETWCALDSKPPVIITIPTEDEGESFHCALLNVDQYGH